MFVIEVYRLEAGTETNNLISFDFSTENKGHIYKRSILFLEMQLVNTQVFKCSFNKQEVEIITDY